MVDKPGRNNGPNVQKTAPKLAVPGTYVLGAGTFVPQVFVNKYGLNVGFSRFSLDVQDSGLASLHPGARSFPYIRNGKVMIEVRNEKGHKLETLPREAKPKEAATYVDMLNREVLQSQNLTTVARESAGGYFIEMKEGKAELFEVKSLSPLPEEPEAEEPNLVRSETKTLLDYAREEEEAPEAGEVINYMVDELTSNRSVGQGVTERVISNGLTFLKEKGIKVPAEDFRRIFDTANKPLTTHQKLNLLRTFGPNLTGEEVVLVAGMANGGNVYAEAPESVRPTKPNEKGIKGKMQKLGVKELDDTIDFGREFGLTCSVDGVTRPIACTDGKLYYYGNPNVPYALGGVTKTPLPGSAMPEAERKIKEFLSETGLTLGVQTVVSDGKSERKLAVVAEEEGESFETLTEAYRDEAKAQAAQAAQQDLDEEAPTDEHDERFKEELISLEKLHEFGIALHKHGLFSDVNVMSGEEMDLLKNQYVGVSKGTPTVYGEGDNIFSGSLIAAYYQAKTELISVLPEGSQFKFHGDHVYLDVPGLTSEYRAPSNARVPSSVKEEFEALLSWKKGNGLHSPTLEARMQSKPKEKSVRPIPPAPKERVSEMSPLADGEYRMDDFYLKVVNSVVAELTIEDFRYSIGSGRLFKSSQSANKYRHERVDNPADIVAGLAEINYLMDSFLDLSEGPNLGKLVFDVDPADGAVKAYEAGDMSVGEILEELDYCGVQVEEDGFVTLKSDFIDFYSEVDQYPRVKGKYIGVVDGNPIVSGEAYRKSPTFLKEKMFRALYRGDKDVIAIRSKRIAQVLNRRFVTQRLARQNVFFKFDEETMKIKVHIDHLEEGTNHAGVPAHALGEVALAGMGFEGANLLTQYRKGLISWPSKKNVDVWGDYEEDSVDFDLEELPAPLAAEGEKKGEKKEEDVRAAANEAKEEVPSFRPEEFGKILSASTKEDAGDYWKTFDENAFKAHYGSLLQDNSKIADFLLYDRQKGVAASLMQRRAKKLVLQLVGFDKVPSHAAFKKKLRKVRANSMQDAAKTDKYESFVTEYLASLDILKTNEDAYEEFFKTRVDMPTNLEWKIGGASVLAGWYGLRTARLGLGAFVGTVAGFGSRAVRTVTRPFAVAARRFGRATFGGIRLAYNSVAGQIQKDESEITGGFFARQWEKAKRNTSYAGRWAFNRSAAVVAAGMISLPAAAYGTVDAAVTLPVATVASFAGVELMPKGGEAAAAYVTVDRIADSCASVLGADSDELKEIKKQGNNTKAIEAAMTALAAKGVEDPEKFLQNAGMLALADEGKRGFFDRIRTTDKVGVVASTKALGRGVKKGVTAPIRGLDIAPVKFLRTKLANGLGNVDPNDLVRVRDVLKKVGPDFEKALAEQEAKHPGETLMNFVRAFERLPDEYIDALSKAGLDFANVGLMGQLLPEILKWHSHKTHPEKKYDNYEAKLAGMGTALPAMDDLEYKAFVGSIDLAKMAAEYAPLMGDDPRETLNWLHSHSQNKKVARYKVAQFFGEDPSSTPIEVLLRNKIVKVFDALVARPSMSPEERILKKMIQSMLQFVERNYSEIYSA